MRMDIHEPRQENGIAELVHERGVGHFERADRSNGDDSSVRGDDDLAAPDRRAGDGEHPSGPKDLNPIYHEAVRG
jgi:hypothetical protein